ncbi:uncharacterized protein LOC121734663 [Aricia agestis]|uniref:uncharacterized protein LOC121734663 n=1 Tax=Aricia agestis TaxID=91739 RepID=UPI001C208B9D|nr:uncharacterized protein LOC121734663 [Aricia agestis]
MKTKFSFSLESIPRQKGFGCLSLKFGSIASALILILYSVFAIAQCLAALNVLPPHWSSDNVEVTLLYTLVIGVTISHTLTLFLSTLMLIGVLREKSRFIKPWVLWTTIQVSVSLLLFIFFSTMSIVNHSPDNSLLLYVVEFLGLMIRFYMLMIVSSYYKQLEEEGSETERLRQLINNELWYNSA